MSPFSITILTLFPEFFEGPLSSSLLRRAQDSGVLQFNLVDIRSYATDKHRTTDDRPFGGGAGMVMKPEPLVAAIEAATHLASALAGPVPRILLTPQGEPFSQKKAAQLSQGSGLILVCGHYEGVDERVREGWIDYEISVGDYVLTGGEPAALIVSDAVSRLVKEVVGNPESIVDESFQKNLLEYPHYTRPRVFRGMEVPSVLLEGNHAKIKEWRHDMSLKRTEMRRPDLLKTQEEKITEE